MMKWWKRLVYQRVKQISAGCVVYRKGKSGPKILLIFRGKPFNEWVFPKGIVESDDWEKEAMRETKEECGLDVVIKARLPDNEYQFAYDEERKWINKKVVVYLAEAKPGKVDFSGNPDKDEAEEFEKYQWVSPEEAEKMMKYESLKKIMREAGKLLI